MCYKADGRLIEQTMLSSNKKYSTHLMTLNYEKSVSLIIVLQKAGYTTAILMKSPHTETHTHAHTHSHTHTQTNTQGHVNSHKHMFTLKLQMSAHTHTHPHTQNLMTYLPDLFITMTVGPED